MMRRQKRSGRRMAVAFLSVIFACSVFGTTAFASQILPTTETEDPPATSSEESTPESSGGASSSSEDPSSSSESSSQPSSEPSSEPSSSTPSSSSSEPSSSSSEPSSSESSQPENSSSVPVQSEPEPSSDPLPSWHPEESRPSGTITDPHAGVDPTISAPENDDPSALSSQDWSELLSSSSGEETSSDASSEESSSEAGGLISRNDSSWLLFVGILLIILGAGGVGGFVYLQFIRPRKVHHNTLEDISQGDTQYMDIGDTGEIPTEFEDISSYSTGKPAEKGDVPGSESDVNVDISSVSRSVPDPKAANPYGQAMPVVKRAPREGAQVPPAPEGYADINSKADAAKPTVPRLNQEQARKAAQAPAKPKSGNSPDDFDWDQFFNQK